MEKTDFPARCFSWWGLLGLRQLAVCRISKGWSAGAELFRGLSGSSAVQMFVLFPVESACGGRSQPLDSITRQEPQRPALPLALAGREEDAGIEWCRGLLERCLLWALMLLQKGSGGLGARITGKQFPHIHGEWGVQMGQAEFTDFSKPL